MSGRAVAQSAIVLAAAVLVLWAPARANDAAHKIAERFADEAKSGEGKKPAKESRKAAEAKKKEPSQSRRGQEGRVREDRGRQEAGGPTQGRSRAQSR